MLRALIIASLFLVGCAGVPDEPVTLNHLPSQYAQVLDANEYFKKGYQNAEISSEQQTRATKAGAFEVVAVYGDWCHDSHREIPRLIKLLESAPDAQASFHAVGFNKTLDAPVHDISSVEKTPTVFIYRNGQQLGVFVERSEAGIVEDILQIVD